MRLAYSLALLPFGAWISTVDLEECRIPDRAVGCLALAFLLVTAILAPETFSNRVLFSARALAAALALAAVSGGLGLGDAKYAAVLCLALVPGEACFALAAACVAALAHWAAFSRNVPGLPFAPFMTMGALAVLISGQSWGTP